MPREFVGGAAAAELASAISASAATFSVKSGEGAGFPDGATGDFVVRVDRTTAGTEEAILCSSRAGDTFTVAAGGRGFDGTAASSHSADASVEHTIDAVWMQSVDDFLNLANAKGDVIAATAADVWARLAVGANDTALVADSAQSAGVKWLDLTTLLVARALADAKGDLLVATAADTFARLAVGANDTALVADSAQTAGVKWLDLGTLYLELSGGTMTGPLTVQSATIEVEDAAPRLHLDETDAAAWRLLATGGVLFVQFDAARDGTFEGTALRFNQSEQLLMVDGSLATPSLSFTNDPDTGLHRTAGNLLFGVDGTVIAIADRGSVPDAFKPGTDDAVDLGTSTLRWNEVFAVNGTINTSDRRAKDDVRALDPDKATAAIKALAAAAVSFRWQNGSRRHSGFDADQVGDVLGDDSAAYVDPAVSGHRVAADLVGHDDATRHLADLDAIAPPAGDRPDGDLDAAAAWDEAALRHARARQAAADISAPKGLRIHEIVPWLTAALDSALDRIAALEDTVAALTSGR